MGMVDDEPPIQMINHNDVDFPDDDNDVPHVGQQPNAVLNDQNFQQVN